MRCKKTTPKTKAKKRRPARGSVGRKGSPKNAGDFAKPVIAVEVTSLEMLEKNWPVAPDPVVADAFSRLKSALRNLKSPGIASTQKASDGAFADVHPSWPQTDQPGPVRFDPLSLIRQVLMAHDLLFLSRQVTYHIASEMDLPSVWADADKVQFVFSQLVEHLVRRSARGRRIDIGFRKFTLRGGDGLEINFAGADKHLGDKDEKGFITELLQGRVDEVSGVSLADCRQVIVRQQGQLWVDFPKPGTPIYHIILPATEQTAAMERASQQTFKYDISISNYASMRKRFGIKKSQSLVLQIEHYVRSLVRYPIDMVMAIGDKGVITTIYETQRGTAQSVASRISERLGSEKFRIGKKSVDISFSYHLSPLSPSPMARQRGAAGRVPKMP